MLKNIKIYIDGIHCRSCKILIESEIDVLVGVKNVNVDYQTGECQIEFDDEKISQKQIFKAIEKLDYKIKDEPTPGNEAPKKQTPKNLIIAGLLLLLFAAGYYLIKYFGLLEILSKLNETKISYWLIFLIGVLVSFHCIGMCGGMVVAYTAKHQAEKNKGNSSLPHLQYNLGRLISYSAIGAVLGGFGSFFGINPTFTGVITLLAGIFMVLMGLSLLTNFTWLEKIKLRTPSSIARFLYNQKHTKKPKGPFLIGILNGFMPCGPLQAIQLYALASGSIISGALSMGIFALGTAPLMFGFGSFISLVSQDRIKQIMKFSGAIVMVLGLLMFNRGLISFGQGFSGFVSEDQTSQTEFIVTGEVKEYQVANMDLTYNGYVPNVLFVKKDIPVRWIINVKQMSGCTNEIILPDYNIKKKLQYGENIIEFTPNKLGEIKFSCWMKMVWGKFVVTDKDSQPTSQDIYQESLSLPQGGSCGGSGSGCSCGCSSRIKSK